ncbi:DUF4179 domain-containing protein [Paenibacillus sp. LHD-117]|uniref:DUF4179 domain-containing protein n=1 Tax=Paenibacillus sp. LHD-117 TaxID=3071412 RepID=UPI0027E0F7F2|nr:DUF4179 domain-containing protein [Paenibacillus sp. LHD-117]MDQ6422774.1 DUF4179 domain-containing protein [Paenibacillus sp. LHD-117]
MSDSRKKDWDEAKAAAEPGHDELEAEMDDLERNPEWRELLIAMKMDKVQVDQAANAAENPDLADKLDRMLTIGMEEGRKRNARLRGKRMSLQLGAAVVCMLFLLTAFVRISPTFAAIVKEIPGFGSFVELVGYDRSLVSAIDNEYIQVVNKSDERNGYKFTVNGVLADSQRVVLLYSAEGPGINEEDTTFLPYELKDENGEEIMAGVGSSHYFQEAEDKDEGIQDYLDIMMYPGVPVPQEIQFKLQVGGEWLEVRVPIDHAKFDDLREEIEIDQSIEVAGQKVKITKAVITPLQVSITFKAEAGNTKRLNDFIDLELIDDRGRSYRTNTGMGDLDTQIVRHFQSSYFQKPKSLTLKSKGLLMSDRNLTVVLDTKEGKMVSAPDDRLRLVGMTKTSDAIDLKFELAQNNDPENIMRGIRLFAFEGVVRDAAGKTYPIEYGDSREENFTSIQSGGQEGLGTYYYHIPNADYAEPLTIEVDQYLGHAMRDISVKIK